MHIPFVADEGLQNLERLGLSYYEAKVFLALEQLGSSTAKEISYVSKVPRQKVYDVLSALRERSLVINQLTTPATFRAIPLGDAVSFLLKKRLDDYEKLREKTFKFLHNFNEKNREIPRIEGIGFEVMPCEAMLNCIRKSIENAEVSINSITSWKRFSKISMFADEFRQAQKRGVITRFVVQRPSDYDSLRTLAASISVPNSKYRTTAFEPQAIMTLYDEKNVIFIMKTKTGIKESPAIITDNQSFVELAKAYFEKMWMTANCAKKETPNQNPQTPLPV